MCKDCGCGQTDTHDEDEHARMHAEGIPHGHGHHAHGGALRHAHAQAPAPGGVRRIELERKVLEHNDEYAARNRRWLAEREITALNLISAPGTGKTYLLEQTLQGLRDRVPCAVIAGDQKTDRDAQRLAGKGAPVIQIETGNACHLNARQVHDALPKIVQPDTRLLFIENVGNLVCPAAYDLGESFKVALMSVTEGEDKPLKYPSLFVQAPVVVVTKCDLLPHLDWNLKLARENLRAVHAGIFIFEVSAKAGTGMSGWLDYLAGLTA